jgi:hypothetical protein
MERKWSTPAVTYYAVALTLIVVGTSLQLTGHRDGAPYWGLGVVMALGPGVTTWLRQQLHNA